MRALSKGLIASAILGLLFFAGFSTAQTPSTLYYQTYLSLDGDPATGCTVTVPDYLSVPQTFPGVEVSVIVTVTNGVLASAERLACSGGSMVLQGPDNGHPTYTLTSAFIEYRLPDVAITPQTTIGFAASTSPNFDIPSDVMFESNGQPILLAPLLRTGSGVPIPVSTPILLLLIAIAAGLIAARYLRTSQGRRIGALALIVCLTGISGAVLSAAQIILDGTGRSWTGIPVLATDPEGDAPYPEIDLLRAYGLYLGNPGQDNVLYLKLDLKQKPSDSTTPQEPTDFRLLGATVTEPDNQSKVIASGTANQIRGTAAKVRIKNTRTGETVTASLVSNAWQGQLTAKTKDVLELTPIAADNSEGGTIKLTVQGTAQEPTLPPDPINGNIAPQLDPLAPYTVYDSTKFLYTNNPPTQTGVAPDTIKPKFASLLVGKTLDRNDQPLSGVTVKVKDHGQYGQTLTREDGQWDLVVNGGQWFTVEYSKDGFLTSQRKVQVAWQDYGYLPDVVLIPLDQKVSVIDLTETGPDAPAFQIHQGTMSNDADGQRQATVLFPKGVTASLQMPDGSTQPINTLNVRATEYTIGTNGPNAMPGELPPATGYTYAVELSVDQAMEAGANHVNFSQPLPLHVDNFLNFPVGEIVPLGWYDYDKKAWVPDEDGYVIQVLSINNGSAVLDVKGNGTAATQAELDALGITDEELKAIAQLYPVGKTLWRNRVRHFTPWDCNFAAGAQPCNDREEACSAPNDDEEPEEPEPDPEEDPCVEGCVIRTGNRSIGESVNVSGTPFALHYESRRLQNWPFIKNTMARRLRDARPSPIGLVGIFAEARILGRITTTFDKPANQVGISDTSEYSWDGKDRFGRTISSGVVEAQHIVTYAHQGVYLQSVAQAQRSFGQYSGTLTALSSRGALIFGISSTSRYYFRPPLAAFSGSTEKVDTFLTKTANLGRWTLSAHHHYDPVSHVLEMGNGMDRTSQTITPQLKRVFEYRNIGNSRRTEPLDVEPLPDGSVLYLVDHYDFYNDPKSRRTIERVSEDGTSRETLLEAVQGEDLYSSIYSSNLIRYDQFNRGIYIAAGAKIFYRRPNGQIEWIAGANLNDDVSSYDYYDPRRLRLGTIRDMAVGHDGSLYIVDGSVQGFRKIDTSRQATIIWFLGLDIYSIAMSASGQLFIGALDRTSYGCSLQKVDTAGRMSDVAGGVAPNCSTENNATDPDQALFPFPQAVATGYRNDVYFATNSFVRRLANNRLSLLLGNSEVLGGGTSSREPADGQFDALNILINASPMKVDPDGNIYFKSAAGHIFMMEGGLPGFSGNAFSIPSSDGREIYYFSAHGRHLETLDALTGAMIYRFGYGADGLDSIIDHDGNETRIERNGDQVTIISPYGHRTEISVNNGNAIAIKNPADEAWHFSYNDKGLMRSATTPRGQTSTYEWDAKDRLIADRWPNGGGWIITSDLIKESWGGTTHKVSMTSGEGRTTLFESKNSKRYWSGKPPTTQTYASTITTPDGLVVRTENQSTASASTYHPDGTQTNTFESGDPRFGVMAPYNSSFVRLGNKDADDYQEVNLWQTFRWTETASGALVPVVSWGETVRNGADLFSMTEYRHADRRWRVETPSGKETLIDVDLIHRPLKVQKAGEPTTVFAYDSRGRMETMVQIGTDGAGAKQWRYNYDAHGNLTQIVDPLNRTSGFGYDAVGRVTKQTLPDGREVATKYDKQGNLEELKTPAGDIHRYVYGAMEDVDSYTPPAVGGSMVTTYQYDKDRKLTGITLPNASAIGMEYGQTSGRLQRVTSVEPDKVPSYDIGGRLIGWAQGSNALTYGYGSLYPESVSWSGDIRGRVISHREAEGHAYFNNRYYGIQNKGWLTGTSVVDGMGFQKRQDFKYDVDGILSEIELNPGSYSASRQFLRLERDDDTGRLKRLYGWLSKDRDERTYDTFGAVQSYRFNKPSNILQNFHLNLSNHEQPADGLIVKGQISRAGQYAYFQNLILSPSAEPFSYQYIPIAENGAVNTTMDIPGATAAPQSYRLRNTYEGDDWWRDIGNLSKIERETTVAGRLLAAQNGIVYYEAGQTDDGNHTIGRYRPASNSHDLVEIEAQESSYGIAPELIGVDSQGRMYFHHTGGSWSCGAPSEENTCVTVQSDGVPAQLVLTVPQNDNEVRVLRLAENPGGQPSFYSIRYEPYSYYGAACNDIIVEQWKDSVWQNVTRIKASLPSGDCRFDYSTGNILQASVYGQDLLLAVGGQRYSANTTAAYRIKPSGQVTEISVPPAQMNAGTIRGMFAVEDNTCLMDYAGEPYYQCFNQQGHSIKRGILPITSEIAYYTLYEPPVFDASTQTHYYLPGLLRWFPTSQPIAIATKSAFGLTLWSLKDPLSPDAVWKDVPGNMEWKLATLTIIDDTSYVEEGYSVTVERDLLGRVTKKTEVLDDIATVQSYEYDLAGRLVKVTGDTTETWGYDNNGNRTHRNGSQIATFDAQDRILTQGGVSYSHNAIGQRTEKNQLGQITRYDYDVFGGLKQVVLPSGTAIAYAQDPLGRRIGRKVNGSWTHKWLYKDSLNPIAELDGNDRLRKLFVYADKGHVPAYMITYNADGTEDKQYRIVSDLLGSVRVVYDLDSGDEVQRIDYDVWGNITNDTNPGFQPFGFAGGLYDPQAKLTRFGARDYDAETGRWTAKDPIQFAGGDTNLYGYVANDPVNFIDPEGKARACQRPLRGFPGRIGPAYHDHIFYDDGTDVGFSKKGLNPDKEIQKDRYDYSSCREIGSDKEVKAVVEVVAPRYSAESYDLLKHNCQDFVQDVERRVNGR